MKLDKLNIQDHNLQDQLLKTAFPDFAPQRTNAIDKTVKEEDTTEQVQIKNMRA